MLIPIKRFMHILEFMFNSTHLTNDSRYCIIYYEVMPNYFTRYLYDHMVDYNTLYLSCDIIQLELFLLCSEHDNN